MEVDLEKIAAELIRECETQAITWKGRAEGVKLLVRKLVEADGIKDDNKPTS